MGDTLDSVHSVVYKHPYTPLYTLMNPYTPLYTLIQPYTPLYTPIHSYTPLYTPIHPYTETYRDELLGGKFELVDGMGVIEKVGGGGGGESKSKK